MSRSLSGCDIPCVHGKTCCSIPLIRRGYKEQLLYKFNKVLKSFLDEGFAESEIRPVLRATRASPLTLGYRNKAKWILTPTKDRNGGGIKMGMYLRGTHDVADISECAIHAPNINEISRAIKAELIRHRVQVGSDDLSKPSLRYMIVRYSFREKKLITVFVTTAARVPGLDKVFHFIETRLKEKVVAIVQNINADETDVLLGEANRFHSKTAELTETMGLLRVPVGPLSFLQVNTSQAAYLYQRVKKLIGKGPFQSGLDLYSGVGIMAMHLAPFTKRILAVEEMGSAALESITAVRRNRVHNVLQLCCDAVEGITTFANEWGFPDWVVLNPPRKGCDVRVLDTLLTRMPRKLIYVSCNPQSLARDLRHLKKEKPELIFRTIEPVDMFPQTEHVECIVLLENPNFKRTSKKVSASLPQTKAKSGSLH